MKACVRLHVSAAAMVLVALGWVWSVRGQTPQQLLPLAGRAQVDAASELTRLDRQTGRLTSEAAITVKKVGERPIRPPLVVVVELEAPEGLSTITVADASGGIGTPPWQCRGWT
jgi:hypothetical protein